MPAIEITPGHTFTAGETVTPAKLNAAPTASVNIGILQIVAAEIAPKWEEQDGLGEPNATPSVSDGVEVFSAAITPTSDSNRVLVAFDVNIWGDESAHTDHAVGVALFRGSTIIANRVQRVRANNGQQGYAFSFTHLDAPGADTETTYTAIAYTADGDDDVYLGINKMASTGTAFRCGPALLIELAGVED